MRARPLASRQGRGGVHARAMYSWSARADRAADLGRGGPPRWVFRPGAWRRARRSWWWTRRTACSTWGSSRRFGKSHKKRARTARRSCSPPPGRAPWRRRRRRSAPTPRRCASAAALATALATTHTTTRTTFSYDARTCAPTTSADPWRQSGELKDVGIRHAPYSGWDVKVDAAASLDLAKVSAVRFEFQLEYRTGDFDGERVFFAGGMGCTGALGAAACAANGASTKPARPPPTPTPTPASKPDGSGEEPAPCSSFPEFMAYSQVRTPSARRAGEPT